MTSVVAGVTLRAFQELLGCATIELTMRYAHRSADARRDAVRLLDDTETRRHGKTMAKHESEGETGS